MTRLRFVLTAAILGLASIVLPTAVAAQGAAGVTGAAEAIFPNGAAFNGVPLGGLTLAQGLIIKQDGSATGQFQTVLSSTSLLGVPRNVIVEGKVTAGSLAGAGSATFSGTAIVDMGDGTATLLEVPFSVTVSTRSLGLTLYATELPTATLSAGSITIE
jgi:hypothetical protein